MRRAAASFLLAALCMLQGAPAGAEVDPNVSSMQPPKPALMTVPSVGITYEKRPTEPLVPIALDRRGGDQAFVQMRCASLVQAVQARTPMEVMNPLTGSDPTRGKALEWAQGVDTEKSFPLINTNTTPSYFADYFYLFGFVQAKQHFIEDRVYLRDKALCLPLLKYYEQ